MILVFVSNMLNHHQQSLCEEFRRQFDEFYFIATEEKQSAGYQKFQNAEYVLNYFEEDKKAACIQKIDTADIVIYGACPDELISLRMKQNKLSFLYSERFLKKGVWRAIIPSVRRKIKRRIAQYKKKNIYVLCASAYLSRELTLFGFEKEKCFKWGYFPKVEVYEIDSLINARNTGKVKILWAGRLLKWKHPDDAVELAMRLKEKNILFDLNIIGDGELKERLEKKIPEDLKGYIHLLGSKSPDEVRKYMKESDIYIATSDYYEGWGAVINEAMSSGCAVVASHAMGSVPYLIEQGKTGYVYEYGKKKILYQKVESLCKNEDLRKKMAKAAYIEMCQIWNPEVAAAKFKILVEKILNHDTSYEEKGPCSKAQIVKNRWIRDYKERI